MRKLILIDGEDHLYNTRGFNSTFTECFLHGKTGLDIRRTVIKIMAADHEEYSLLQKVNT